MATGDLHVFALNASRRFGERIALHLGVPLSKHEERSFEDGEHKTRALESVRGGDVFVVQSLYGDYQESVNDKLCRLLFFIGALRDAGANRVTAVTPYLCYARKDRRTKPQDPVTTRYIAQMFESVGADGLITMDVHNVAAFENAFRCRTVHLVAEDLFVKYFAGELNDEEIAVVSPDVGGVKRAESLREALARRLGRDVASGFMEKQRSSNIVKGDVLVGDVEGRSVVLYDDMIGTGTTMVRAAEACRKQGARRVIGAATHGLFMEPAEARFKESAVSRVVVTSTVPPFRLDAPIQKDLLTTLDAAGPFADAIERVHSGSDALSFALE